MDLERAKQIGREYMQGFTKGWADVTECDVPAGCVPCRFCGKRCMLAEEIREGDWYGRGRVVRMEAVCDAAEEAAGGGWDRDLIRTEFAPEAEAVAAWNKLMSEG